MPQNPDDEPASVLLKKIDSQRKKLIQQGKLKNSEGQHPSEIREPPYQLPDQWEWTRISELLPELQNGASSRGDASGTEVIVLRLADVKSLEVALDEPRRLTISATSIRKYHINVGDILVIRVNGSSELVGRFIPVKSRFDGIFCDHFIRMRIDPEIIDPFFLTLAGSTKLIRSQIEKLFVSTAGQKTVNQKHIGSLLLPLPPIKAQQRIVKKVDELMTLCDQLKARLGEAGETRTQLAGAVVERAVQ